MARERTDSLRWMGEGTTLLLGTVEGMSDDRLAGPCTLPGWSVKHLLSHLVNNASALMNLVSWARNGVETPMYSSAAQRDADIAAGSRLPAAELRDRLVESAVALDASLAGLAEQEWRAPVRTAQNRAVTAEEIPWMRTREVMVHAVDLAAGVRFADLPADFLASLIDDIVAKRAKDAGPALSLTATDNEKPTANGKENRWTLPGEGDPTDVRGPLADLAAYLAGRAAPDGRPELPRWL